jgi:hypothetical protein
MTNMTKAELEAENEALRQELEAVRSGRVARTTGVPPRPSFGMSEGERDEIERKGSAVSPFDGKRRTAEDLPEGVSVDESARQEERTTGRLIDYSAPPAPAREGE